MRILYVIGRLGMGGDSVAVLNTLDVLIKLGKLHVEEVSFLTHDIGYNKSKVEQLKKRGHNVIIIDGDVRKLGVKKYYDTMVRVINNSGPYDVMHIHTSMQSGVALRAAKKCGISKRICHAHTNSIQRKTNAISKFILTPFFKYLIENNATEIVACGKMAGEFLYGSKMNFKILKNGINLKEYQEVTDASLMQLKKELGISNKEFIVGHVGRFSTMKNHHFIIELAEQLKEHSEIVFVMVGDGEEFDNIQDMAEQKQLNCVFTGRRSDVSKLMCMFDMLILPSLPGEGFPMTLVEAQAGGCKCLVSDNVTKEADLGLGLVTYHSIEDIDYWTDAIVEKRESNEKRENCIKLIQTAGFNQEEAALEWYKLYT